MVVTHYNLDMKKTSLDSFLECLHPRASYSNGSKIVKRQEQGPEKSSRGLCAERTAGMGGRKLIDRSTAGGAGILSVLWTGLGNIIDLSSENWNTIFVIVIFPAALAFSFPLNFLVFSEGNTALVLLCHFGVIYFKIIVRDFWSEFHQANFKPSLLTPTTSHKRSLPPAYRTGSGMLGCQE